MDWLERYQAGQHHQVWWELRQLGARVRDPEYLPHAQAVCDEMARRARHNIEMLVRRLTDQGFTFHANNHDRTPCAGFIPATADAADLVTWLDAQPFGPIPLTVASWIRLVGDVWLVGTHPEWPKSSEADPLVLQFEGSAYPGYSMRGDYADSHTYWQDWAGRHPQEPRFTLDAAPDRLTKANISGGPPYGVEVPDRCADGLFRAETTMPFVSYLNLAFVHGGFLYYDYYDVGNGGWTIRPELAEDLLPL